MPEVMAVLIGVPVALLIGAVVLYIGGFIVSMVVAMFYVPIQAIEHHLPHGTHTTHHHRPLVAG